MRTLSHYQASGNFWRLLLIWPFVWFAVAGQGLHSHELWNEGRSTLAPHFSHLANGDAAHNLRLDSRASSQKSEFCAACQWSALAFTATATQALTFVAFCATIYGVATSRDAIRQPVKFRGRGPPMLGSNSQSQHLYPGD